MQRLLRVNIGVVAPDVLVIAEEFGEWDHGRRRIDLLGVDEEANLVVIELKRGEDGEYMDLQAIRYAAMVSGMTFARAAQVHQAFLDRTSPGLDAKSELLKHLGWAEPREDDFAKDVRLVLVSGDFSKELTTAVLWLNERGMDIRCVRMKPYANGGETIVDVQQVVPLPEAEDYMVQVREKEQAQRAENSTRHSQRRAFWTVVLPEVKRETGRFTNWAPPDGEWLASGLGVKGVRVVIRVKRDNCAADCYIDAGPGSRDWNKAVFDWLYARRAEIDAAFGPGLEWHRMDNRQASSLTVYPVDVGYTSAPDQWPEAARGLSACVQRMYTALRPHLESATNAVGERV
ncbi:MAG: DUF4268 domain-containing protein [Phycisphaeraceae bacterium]|nr:MAG: DUF4268 domain-containing protein [Phycisphaeraceae bacterium]